MKRVILAIAVVVASLVAWYLWQSRAPERSAAPTGQESPAEPEPTETTGPAQPTEPAGLTETTGPTETRPDHPQARPVPPEPRADDSSAPIERVDFDRRPWNPREETREKYEARARQFEAFDRFVAETGMSEERAGAVLMALFDYQEMNRIMDEEFWSRKPFRDKAEFEYYNERKSWNRSALITETKERLRDMLSEDEMRAWRRNMEGETLVWSWLASPEVFGCIICPAGPLRDAYINRPSTARPKSLREKRGEL